MTIQPKPADDVDSVGEKTENYEIPEAYMEILDAYAKLFLETGETRHRDDRTEIQRQSDDSGTQGFGNDWRHGEKV